MSVNYEKYGRKYYLRHKAEILCRQKVRFQNPQAKLRRKLKLQEWYRINRERLLAHYKSSRSAPAAAKQIRQYHSKWYIQHRIKKLAANKLWRDTHVEQQTFFSRRRRVRKLFIGGSHTLEEWHMVKQLYGNACANCGRIDVAIHQDHKIPLARGGTDNIDNIQPLCKPCNSSKGTRVWFASRPVDKSFPNLKFPMFSPALQPVLVC